MIFIRCVSFLLAIASVSALGKIWKFHKPKINERTMKTILQSCYGNESLSNEILIYGDFDEVIDELPITQVKSFSTMRNHDASYYREHQAFPRLLLYVQANVVVFIGDSLAELQSFLLSLASTRYWDHMARFLILGKWEETCENAAEFLRTTWKFDILNAVYICSESPRTSTLYTLNPITDYAPYPWKRMERADDLYVFHQAFYPGISCQHLNYDKTKFLNGYEIKVVLDYDRPQLIPGKNYFELMSKSTHMEYRTVHAIVKALNMSCRLELEKTRDAAFDRCREYSSDLMLTRFTLPSNPELSFLFPHYRGRMVAVVKLNPEVSTLEKILHLWSPAVLIVAAVAVAILFLALTITNRSFSSAMLDVTRLLIYSSILTNNRTHSFRIYFTTMLIFMVISNGVFQGKIAAFLTTRERVPAIRTIDELIELKYEMYTEEGTKNFVEKRCPKCNFTETSWDECVQFMLNGTLRTCAMSQIDWDESSSTMAVDYVQEPLNEEFESFKCRRNWPLHNRFNNMVMKFVESGIGNHWYQQFTHASIVKRKAMEAEWSSPEYRPVRLVKLDFAFHLLAIGLSLATIVFALELLVSKLLTFSRTR